MIQLFKWVYRHGLARNANILAIHDGFEGLVAGSVKSLDWKSVYGIR